jgi:photosystem II stability/assembly factor-like uncharacterized protein
MKRSLSFILGIFLLAMIACGPFTSIPASISSLAVQPTVAVNPIATPSPESPSQPVSTPTLAAQPSPVEDTPTVEQSPEPSPTAWPTSVPQPPAPGQLPAGDHIQLDEVHMVSLTEGWGILGRTLLTTADGGKTWREVTPAVAQADKIYGAFLDASHAWVVFSYNDHLDLNLTVYFTTDGGQTWSTSGGLPLNPQVMGDSTWAELTALDALDVWVLARGVYVGAGTHHDHDLLHTTDGGYTWTSLDGQISDDYTGLVFADPMDGMRTLQDLGAYGPGPASYEATSDGGANWVSVTLPPPLDAPDLFNQYPYCETYQPVMLSAYSIRLLVGCFDYSDPPQKYISYLYITLDGGTSWKTVRLPAKVLAPDYRLLFFGADQALLLGREIYSSADGGKTWSHVQSVNWDGKFSFVDPQNGWAVANSTSGVALVRTANGGKTWNLVNPATVK